MNIWKITLQNIKSKPLYTFLSVFTLALSVGLLLGIQQLKSSFKHQIEKNLAGIDLVVGAKGSPLQLVLASVLHLDNPTGNISYKDAKKIGKNPLIKTAVPISYGDNYKGYKIVGTTDDFLKLYKAELEKGTTTKKSLEVVIGATIAEKLKLSIGDTFLSSHGLIENEIDVHNDVFTVVGILKPTYQAIDRLIITKLESIWDVHDHHDHEEGEHDEHKGLEDHEGDKHHDNDHKEHTNFVEISTSNDIENHDDHDDHDHHHEETHADENHEKYTNFVEVSHTDHKEEHHDEHDHDEGEHNKHKDLDDHEDHENHENHEEDNHKEHTNFVEISASNYIENHNNHDDHDHHHKETHADENHEKHTNFVEVPHTDHKEEHHDEHDHDEHHETEHKDHKHESSEEDKEITSLLISFKNPVALLTMPRKINESTNMQAALPKYELDKLYNYTGIGFKTINWIAYLILIISGMIIFVSLYKMVKERSFDLALLRTYGASNFQLVKMMIYEGFLVVISAFIIGVLLVKIVLKFAFNLDQSGYQSILKTLSFGDIFSIGIVIVSFVLVAIGLSIYPIVTMNVSKILSNEK